MSLLISLTSRRAIALTSLVNFDGWLPSTGGFTIYLPLFIHASLCFFVISLVSRVSRINLRPGSITISEADGSIYLGHNGSTTLLLRKSVHFGLAPSMSSIYKGLDTFLICLLWLGTGSM